MDFQIRDQILGELMTRCFVLLGGSGAVRTVRTHQNNGARAALQTMQYIVLSLTGQ